MYNVYDIKYHFLKKTNIKYLFIKETKKSHCTIYYLKKKKNSFLIIALTNNFEDYCLKL